MLRLILCYKNADLLVNPAKKAKINYFKHHSNDEHWLTKCWQARDFIKKYFSKFYIQAQKPNRDFIPEGWEDLLDREKLEVVIIDGSQLRDFRNCDLDKYKNDQLDVHVLMGIQELCEVWLLEDVLLAMSKVEKLEE